MVRPSQILGQMRGFAVPLVIFSFITNLSILVSPLFMMHVLDRVVPSGNINTLILLLMLALLALIATAIVEFFRDQALGGLADWVEQALTSSVFSTRQETGVGEPLRQISKLRDFLGGQGFSGMMDIPWIPLFLLALYLVHPAFLLLICVMSGLFLFLGWLDDVLSQPAEDEMDSVRRRGMSSIMNLESLGHLGHMMSMGKNLKSYYLNSLDAVRDHSAQARRVRNLFGSSSKFLRTGMQIVSLALGAFLVTEGELSAGGMIGASILLGKAAGIIEAAVKLIGRRGELIDAFQTVEKATATPMQYQTEIAELSGGLTLVDVTFPRGAGLPPRLDRINLTIEAGECVAILGESGCGKTTLIDTMAGISAAPIGNCFLDQTDIRTLDEYTHNTVIGYVPQSGHVFPGTIAQNIARFSPQPDDAKVLAAARIAGIHGMISALPDAYETDLGRFPHLLSAGQRQRLAFARAMYEPPKYLFMDEPNALLDHQAERQMADAIYRLKKAGTTIVMSAHRMGIVNLADRVVVLERGRIIEQGSRAEIMGRMANGHRRLRLPISGGAIQDLVDWVHRQFLRDGDEGFKTRAATIATELYMFARENGDDEVDRVLSFEFDFIDDLTCSITMSEPRHTEVAAKIHKVKKVVEMSIPDIGELQKDEQSLATVMRLAETFEHRSEDHYSAFFARIAVEMNGGVRAN